VSRERICLDWIGHVARDSDVSLSRGEDQDSLRGLMLRSLAGAGYRVLEAQDGVDALEVLRRNLK